VAGVLSSSSTCDAFDLAVSQSETRPDYAAAVSPVDGYRIYALGEVFADKLFQTKAGACTPVAREVGDTYYMLGDEVPASRFVEFTKL
jgi:hypothetical protein